MILGSSNPKNVRLEHVGFHEIKATKDLMRVFCDMAEHFQEGTTYYVVELRAVQFPTVDSCTDYADWLKRGE